MTSYGRDANRKKVDKEKLKLIRVWKRNLNRTLKAGRGFDIYLDQAMREIVKDLQEWTDEYKVS